MMGVSHLTPQLSHTSLDSMCLRYLFIIMLSTHWFACMFRLVPLVEADDENSWIVGYFGTADVDPLKVYNVAWYWSVMTLTR